jgi:hypothetical protein
MSAERDRQLRRLQAQRGFDALAEELTELPDVDRAMMFGSKGIRARGRFLAFVGAAGQLVVKLPSARVAELVAVGTGSRVRIGRNLAAEWIGVPYAPDADGGDLWRLLLLEAYRYAA